MDKRLSNSISKIKKAELHIHLDGAIDAKTVMDLAKKQGKKFYFPTTYKGGRKSRIAGKEIDTSQRLKQLWKGQNYSIPDRFHATTGVMQTRESLERVATEHVKYLAKDNRIYTETRFAPQYHTKEGLSLEEAIGYTLDGLEKGSEQYGINTKLIVCIGRESDEELSKKVVRAALQFAGDGVVGIDLACWENPFPPELHYEAFKLTFDSSLKRTVHAGELKDETEGLRNIFTALKLLKADGLGHAIALKKRNYGIIHDLISMARDNNVRIESCPRSNMTEGHIGKVEDLDLHTLSIYGLLRNITINSDDPEMWTKGSLTENYKLVMEGYGLERDLNHLQTLFTNPIRMAFGLDAEEKRRYIKEIEESFAKETA